MTIRISPLWYPLMVVASPFLLIFLIVRCRRYRKNIFAANKSNQSRIDTAKRLDLEELEYLHLTVLVDGRAKPDFAAEPAISYLLKTNKGQLLLDLGHGPDTDTLEQNVKKLGTDSEQIDGVVISHLHPDHMGGYCAAKNNKLTLPKIFEQEKVPICFLPQKIECKNFIGKLVTEPTLLPAGIASTGPLSRSLFLMGQTDEQALVLHLKGKGLVIITGCGHPTIELIHELAQKLSPLPLYAIIGGLHFPVKDSPLKRPGLKVLMIWGTGKPPWKKITDKDLSNTINNINQMSPEKLFISGHDSCNHALQRFQNETSAQTTILEAGGKYDI